MKEINLVILCFFVLVCIACNKEEQEAIRLQNATSELVFDNGLKYISSYSNRDFEEYMSGNKIPLYCLKYGNNYDSVRTVNSFQAVSTEILRQNDQSLEILYNHPDEQLKVTCLVRTESRDSLHYWSIKIEKQSDDTIVQISYPQLPCKIQLGSEESDDAVLYPLNEGVLLTKMDQKGRKMNVRYPGKLSAQLMYNFDSKGGLFYAAFDGMGYPKNLILNNDSLSLVMSQEYVLQVHPAKEIEMPYEVVTGIFGGRWEAGANIYRNWSDTQLWTEKRIDERQTPDWLRQPNLFLNSSFNNQSMTVIEVDQMIKAYRDFYNIPIVTAVFGWEKNGTWIGPDYFPPNPSSAFYQELTNKLGKRGDHLHFYTSGYRWGVKKPINEKGLIPRVYTNYDGYDDFNKRGKHLAVVNPNGELKMQQPRWADNYYMCAGHNDSHAILENVYDEIYSMGVAGVDLDQNLGGEAEDCFNREHSHPMGGGLWQTLAVENFLTSIAQKNALNGNTFQGVEETCERYAHLFDIYHGRVFTDTGWPVYGPGAVSVPLYIYLYHEYQLGYAGWIDKGFSPSGFIKYGLGRAFIFGMMPGIRVSGSTELKANVSDDLLMLKSYVELLKLFPEFLLKGRMQGEAGISGAKDFNHEIADSTVVPIHWSSVQGIIWENHKNEKKGIAVANMLDEQQKVSINVHGIEGDKFHAVAYTEGIKSRDEIVSVHDGKIQLSMQPWELCMVIQN